MATNGKRAIFVDGCTLPVIEGVATAAVRPGALVELSAAGLAENNNAATVFGTMPVFADYNMLQAKPVGTSWAIGENVICRQLEQGKIANVLVAASQNITSRGVGLSSNGAGALKIALTNGTEHIVAYSDEIINTGGSVALVRVRGA